MPECRILAALISWGLGKRNCREGSLFQNMDQFQELGMKDSRDIIFRIIPCAPIALTSIDRYSTPFCVYRCSKCAPPTVVVSLYPEERISKLRRHILRSWFPFELNLSGTVSLGTPPRRRWTTLGRAFSVCTAAPLPFSIRRHAVGLTRACDNCPDKFFGAES